MNYTQRELQLGTQIEIASTEDARLAESIARRNLIEDASYYSKLQASGLEPDDTETEPEAQGEVPQTAQIAAVILPTDQSDRTKLTSSQIGVNGVNKPLTSDKLKAPETKVVKGKNITDVTKTPPIGGAPMTADASDHFGNQLANLTACADDITQTHEMIPANIYEGGAQLKKK